MSNKKWDVVIGLEIHAELNTKTKLLCGCANNPYNAEPNSCVCDVCLGIDEKGISLNREAVRKTVMAGLALGCNINNITFWDRKFYNYVDSPKGFQTTQLYSPICIDGGFKLKNGKFAALKQIHLEEDASKLLHEKDKTLIDLNRGGVPLNEIVTMPVFSNADEAVEFLEEVRSRLIFAGVADCRMEEGGMRCDVSLSIKPAGSTTLGERTETKNLNSFKMVARAIEYETKRQIELLESGGKVEMQTLRWDDVKGINYPMRKKETENDYNYTPDVCIPVVEITKEDIEAIRASMPKLASQVREELVALGLTEYESNIISSDSSISTFFFGTLKLFNNAKTVCNWVLTNVLAKASSNRILMTAKQLADILKLVDSKKITRTNAVALLDALWNTALDAEGQANKMGMIGGVNSGELEKMIDKLIADNANVCADFKEKPDKVINFFVGQVMKSTQGKADATKAREIIERKLK